MASRVFLVEDDADIAALVRRHLERTSGLEMSVFSTGAAFLEACEGRLPDLVILDLSLPDQKITAVRAVVRIVLRRFGKCA